MQVPLQIAFHNLEASESVKRLIEDKIAWLERVHSRIIACRVVIEAPHEHRRQGKPYQVRLDLTMPGGEIVVNRQSLQPGNLEGLIRDAFETARRQLADHQRRRVG